MDTLLKLFSSPATWAALVTLVAMELVLGIDNLIFISILTNRLPPESRSKTRRTGIALALIFRLVLLGTVAFIVRLTEPVLHVFGRGFSWRDMILMAGGFFLVWKATKEIHHNMDPDPEASAPSASSAGHVGYAAAVGQIVVLDIVFSIDSIVTAVGMTNHVAIMMTAVIITVGLMLVAADPLANFINANPTVVMLALAFLLLIGTALIAESCGAPVPKGYIYGAMAFSALVEGLNMLSRRARKGHPAAPGARASGAGS